MKTIDTPVTVTDEVMAEVRRHKQAIAEQFNYDVTALGRWLQKRQEEDARFQNAQGNHLSENKSETKSKDS
jgi:hypothetical protein